ncbi:MAG: carboxypeptidase-like regulatory domain-containing protein [Acidobacteriota bacterium]|nr:carboxypeptidase-like regulatory domain-containing protein [Acidobacteriota bacterium]
MTKKISIKFLAATIFCLVLGIGHIFAQSTVAGRINGKVVDQQGSLIPNTIVTDTNVGTNKSEAADAKSDAPYRLINLQSGIYTIEVATQGFANFKAENVVVEVGKLTTINASLGVGGTSIEVTVDAPVVNAISQDFNNIDKTAINELSLNGRRVSNFVLLTPGVAPDEDFGLISYRGISGLLNNTISS